MLRHNDVCSTQGLPISLKTLKTFHPQPSLQKTSLALTPTVLFYCSPVFGIQVLFVIKSVVMIFTVGSGEGPTV